MGKKQPQMSEKLPEDAPDITNPPQIRDILWNYVCQFGAPSNPRTPRAGPAGALP